MTQLHRTQVLLEEWQFVQLQKRARRAGTSVAAIVRELVAEELQGALRKPGLESIHGIGGAPGSGRDHDEDLYGG